MKKVIFLIVAVFSMLLSPAYAEQYTFAEAKHQYIIEKLQQPAPESDGRVQTLNEKGAQSAAFDAATLSFIQNSAHHKVLEIGGAYGKTMLETLSKNHNVQYTLNDLDKRHLFIAAHNLSVAVDSGKINAKNTQKIKFISGDITRSDFDITEQYDAILIARVLHFFGPKQMDTVIANLYKLLKPHGRVYVVAITPYVKRYEAFIPVYQERVAKNEAYPGYVTSLSDWLNTSVTSSKQQGVISKEPFMFLDDRVLSNLFSATGFKIITSQLQPLGYQSTSWSLDGRENVILIAEKP